MLDAQTLLTVVATVELGKPALIAHWRAGFCPRLAMQSVPDVIVKAQDNSYFAERTLPKNTSSTLSGEIPALLTAAVVVDQ